MREKRRVLGFTLAEILITLGIIGVVAALTLPTLIQNYEKKVTVNKLKETYSILSQAVRMSEAQNGELKDWDIPNADWNASAYTQGEILAKKYITPYLKVMKTCKYREEGCLPEKSYRLNGDEDNYYSRSTNNTYNIILSNGVLLGFWPRSNLVEIYVDLNARQKPNTSGKDIFDILILKNSTVGIFGNIPKPGVYFYGQGLERTALKNSGYPCRKTGTLTGGYCGALIMLDGWEIKDDYPW